MSTRSFKTPNRSARPIKLWVLTAVVAIFAGLPSWGHAQDKLPSPEPIPEAKLVPDLRTIPVPHDRPAFNVQMVNASLLPRDKEGIWVLDFAFKPLRIRTVEIPGVGRRQVHYLYYKVVNRTGKPRMFVPAVHHGERGRREV